MSKLGPMVEDLSARVRRGDLSPEDQRRLDIALRASLEARLLHEAGLGFDEERAVRHGDDELMRRVVRGVQARTGVRRRALRRTAWALLAAGMLGATAAAAASWALFAVTSATSARSDTDASARDTARPLTAAGRIPRTTKPRASEPPRAAEAPIASSNARVTPGPPGAPNPTPNLLGHEAPPVVSPGGIAEPPGAKQLFSDANALRRRGDLEQAVQEYSELQRRFPDSAEAHHSHLTLGQLYLAEHKAALALAQFRSYATAASLDSLRVEALWGEGQALEQLGQSEQERQVLDDIVTYHPQSVYREAAEQRLTRLRQR